MTKERWLGIIAIIIAGFFAYQTGNIRVSDLAGDPGPKVFPYAACALIAVCGLGLIIQKPKKTAGKFMNKEEWKRAIVLFAIYIIYVVLLWLIGYIATMPIILFAISYLFSIGHNPSILKSALYAIGVSAGLYLFYIVLMQSNLPKGIIWDLFK